MKVDLFLLTQGGKTTVSTMTQALGLMADCDLGTDHLRWMGEARFFYGFLRGLMAFKACPMTMQIKVAEQDKARMVRALEAVSGGTGEGKGSDSTPVSPISDAGSPCAQTAVASLPDLSEPVNESDGWITFDKPAVYMYAGKGPFVSRCVPSESYSLDGLPLIIS